MKYHEHCVLSMFKRKSFNFFCLNQQQICIGYINFLYIQGGTYKTSDLFLLYPHQKKTKSAVYVNNFLVSFFPFWSFFFASHKIHFPEKKTKKKRKEKKKQGKEKFDAFVRFSFSLFRSSSKVIIKRWKEKKKEKKGKKNPEVPILTEIWMLHKNTFWTEFLRKSIR